MTVFTLNPISGSSIGSTLASLFSIIHFLSPGTASPQWIFQMGVHNLQDKDQQPFYNVLVDDDGSIRYAAQESLQLATLEERQPNTHSQVGKYLDEFCGSHYEPNSEVMMLYPEDLPVTREMAGV